MGLRQIAMQTCLMTSIFDGIVAVAVECSSFSASFLAFHSHFVLV